MKRHTAGSYAARLTPGAFKGRLNLREIRDPAFVVVKKVKVLAKLLREASHVVVHTGAGISTAAGIRDFRGPDGIWTRERRGDAARDDAARDDEKNFTDVVPTLAHMVIVELFRHGLVHFVVSQNVDGLHLRSGLPRSALAELHGNVFAEQCNSCGAEYFREHEIDSIGMQPTGSICHRCGAPLVDKLLDWNDPLPDADLRQSKEESSRADLSLVLGSSMQMDPSRGLPVRTLRSRGRVAVCNLSSTFLDDRAFVCVRERLDQVMWLLLTELGLAIPAFERKRTVLVASSEADDGTHRSATVSVSGESGHSDALVLSSVRFRMRSDLGAPAVVRTAPPFAATFRAITPDADLAVVTEVTAAGSTHSVDARPGQSSSLQIVVEQENYGDVVEASRQLEDKAAEGPDDRITYEMSQLFCRSFRKPRGFAMCVLCDEDVHTSQKKKHAKSCPALRNSAKLGT